MFRGVIAADPPHWAAPREGHGIDLQAAADFIQGKPRLVEEPDHALHRLAKPSNAESEQFDPIQPPFIRSGAVKYAVHILHTFNHLGVGNQALHITIGQGSVNKQSSVASGSCRSPS